MLWKHEIKPVSRPALFTSITHHILYHSLLYNAGLSKNKKRHNFHTDLCLYYFTIMKLSSQAEPYPCLFPCLLVSS